MAESERIQQQDKYFLNRIAALEQEQRLAKQADQANNEGGRVVIDDTRDEQIACAIDDHS